MNNKFRYPRSGTGEASNRCLILRALRGSQKEKKGTPFNMGV